MAMLDAIANPPRQFERFAVRFPEGAIFELGDEVDGSKPTRTTFVCTQATHLLHLAMNTIEAALDSNRLLRIHRSHLVNARKIVVLWSITRRQYVIKLRSGFRLQPWRTFNGSAAR